MCELVPLQVSFTYYVNYEAASAQTRAKYLGALESMPAHIHADGTSVRVTTRHSFIVPGVSYVKDTYFIRERKRTCDLTTFAVADERRN
jgi:hypothetical protein